MNSIVFQFLFAYKENTIWKPLELDSNFQTILSPKHYYLRVLRVKKKALWRLWWTCLHYWWSHQWWLNFESIFERRGRKVRQLQLFYAHSSSVFFFGSSSVAKSFLDQLAVRAFTNFAADFSCGLLSRETKKIKWYHGGITFLPSIYFILLLFQWN